MTTDLAASRLLAQRLRNRASRIFADCSQDDGQLALDAANALDAALDAAATVEAEVARLRDSLEVAVQDQWDITAERDSLRRQCEQLAAGLEAGVSYLCEKVQMGLGRATSLYEEWSRLLAAYRAAAKGGA